MSHSRKDGRRGGSHKGYKVIWSSRRNNKKVRDCRCYRWSKTKTHRNERRDGKYEVQTQLIEQQMGWQQDNRELAILDEI